METVLHISSIPRTVHHQKETKFPIFYSDLEKSSEILNESTKKSINHPSTENHVSISRTFEFPFEPSHVLKPGIKMISFILLCTNFNALTPRRTHMAHLCLYYHRLCSNYNSLFINLTEAQKLFLNSSPSMLTSYKSVRS